MRQQKLVKLLKCRAHKVVPIIKLRRVKGRFKLGTIFAQKSPEKSRKSKGIFSANIDSAFRFEMSLERLWLKSVYSSFSDHVWKSLKFGYEICGISDYYVPTCCLMQSIFYTLKICGSLIVRDTEMVLRNLLQTSCTFSLCRFFAPPLNFPK